MAAMVLYVPSNLLVMMHSSDITGTRSDTIISGIAKLWTDGATGIATVVFVASVGVPLFKIAVMIWLLVSVQRRSASARRLRAGLFRVIERIGHWSMLDVFVVALLVALVDFNVARVEPGPAALAFGSVVILTMLAARSFDPRLIWDAPGPEASPGTSSSAPRYPASLTKIMTLYLLFQDLEAGRIKMDSRLRVSKFAASRPSANSLAKAPASARAYDSMTRRSASRLLIVLSPPTAVS